MDHSAAEAAHVHDSAYTETHDHHESSLIYWLVGAVLTIVTVLEVFAAALWFSNTVMLLVLVTLAFVKGALIVAVFMHMQGDAGIFKFVFLAPFSIAATFMIAFLLLFSQHVGIAG